VKVSDYMSSNVITANLRDGLHQTFHRMLERGIRHMPVLGENGELAGIISERDIRRPNFVDDDPNVANYYVLDNNVKVQEAMTSSPITVAAEAEVAAALELFIERRYGALPVVDSGDRLVGMLSAVDLLRAFRDSMGN
jgi:acetoin utilization protein AcuB